jgi:hypothetical protein
MTYQLHCRSTVDVLVRLMTTQPVVSNQDDDPVKKHTVTTTKITIINELINRLIDEESDYEVLTNCVSALTEIANVYTS